MSIEIRKVTCTDAHTLAHIQTESWRSAFHTILDPETLEKRTDPEKSENMYRCLLNDRIGNGYILSVDGNPHCIAWWDAARDAEFAGKAELICIHSLPSNWRKGYGSLMMDRVLSDMKAAGYAEAVLWVFRDNLRARSFYESKGFALTEYTSDRFDAVEVCYLKKL